MKQGVRRNNGYESALQHLISDEVYSWKHGQPRHKQLMCVGVRRAGKVLNDTIEYHTTWRT